MKYIVAATIVAFLNACVSGSSAGDVSVGAVTGTARVNPGERTFHCPNSPLDCRQMARDHCGKAGYVRVMHPNPNDQTSTRRSTSVGGTHGLGNAGRRIETTASRDRVWTVRCK